MMSVTVMCTEEPIVTSISSGEHAKILANPRNYGNKAFVHRHGHNELVTDNVFHTTCIAGDSFLAVLKEYFEPLSDC